MGTIRKKRTGNKETKSNAPLAVPSASRHPLKETQGCRAVSLQEEI